MIVINCALKQEEVKDFLLSLQDVKLTFLKKVGLQMYFECESNQEEAVTIVKKNMKQNANFSALYYNISIM